jgi:hypothetical protein
MPYDHTADAKNSSRYSIVLLVFFIGAFAMHHHLYIISAKITF